MFEVLQSISVKDCDNFEIQTRLQHAEIRKTAQQHRQIDSAAAPNRYLEIQKQNGNKIVYPSSDMRYDLTISKIKTPKAVYDVEIGKIRMFVCLLYIDELNIVSKITMYIVCSILYWLYLYVLDIGGFDNLAVDYAIDSTQCIRELCNGNVNCLLGDFNLPLIDWNNYSSPDNAIYNCFIELFNDLGLHQLLMKIESVQRRFTKAIPSIRHLPYLSRLNSVGLQTIVKIWNALPEEVAVLDKSQRLLTAIPCP
ncbi:hypothetical protein HELRODRAFT_164143 [Helobdella robusta]|uniref:Endonuclease/exonuclease/phosphatase domain-containing protein n=1 Tax=Helobdella robusta TaxID=6412 RepID=T1EUZ9_HELRO|nr:hypothetical protein HELRODRAFT_164143 [Helobdella robusta]ESN94322.1 hypothetical protein HELRODRAFT_164143 [Helobdella robusta]